MTDTSNKNKRPKEISLGVALIPIFILFCSLAALIVFMGTDSITDYAPLVLLASALAAGFVSYCTGTMRRRAMKAGLLRASSQVLPAIPMLIFIALLSTSWMMAGVVPAMVTYGMAILDPRWFLVASCLICSLVSVMTGSSWSTIATIGVALIGIGEMTGTSTAWTAGAVISGAYFGDKISPLSDTTVIASATCEVDIFAHIRYMLITTLPALVIALIVFAFKGLSMPTVAIAETSHLPEVLKGVFHISPWLLLIPVATVVMIALRVPTLLTLGVSSLAGLLTAWFYQGDVLGDSNHIWTLIRDVFAGFSVTTGHDSIDSLISTGGIFGIMPVVFLVLAALVFGWMMIGSGILSLLTERLTRGLKRPASIVSASIASGFTLSACTADQYLSIILGGNMYRKLYRKHRLENRLLSRSLEDSVSATSPLIPWSSCGVTQASVLGVSTVAYLPYCVFNYVTPICGLLIALTGWGIKSRKG